MSDETIDTDQQEMRDLLVRYVLGDVEPEARSLMRRLLEADPALAKEAAELERTLELLPVTSAMPPPPHLRERVLAAARGLTAPRSATARRPHDGARYWRLATVATLAASAVVCALLLVDRAALRHEFEQANRAALMLREPNVVLSFRLAGTGSASAASGVVLLDLDAKRASISVDNLPQAPQGYAYHLWAVLEAKQVPCGRFNPAADGRLLSQFAIPVDSYTSPIQKLILTLQPDNDQAAPKGAAVMSSQA
jgi:anti-sigma-K factor RskA